MGMGGDRRILALLSERHADNQRIREALVRVDVGATVLTRPEEFETAARGAGADLVVCDGAATDPGQVHDWLHDPARAGRPPTLLVIVDTFDRSTQDGEPALSHFLARPFRGEALTALCHALIEGAPSRGEDHDAPSVAVRKPARFSARPLYADAVAFARESLARAREGIAPDMGWARLVAERLHTSLVQNNLLLNRALEPHHRFDLSTHSVNVAIFAGKIANSRDLPLDTTLRTIEAGLVHDIGMARLPDSILFKDAGLTDEERAEMERHPLLGAELIAGLGEDFRWLERAIRQEHERAGGQGYPQGLVADEIDPIARTLGVADLFEAFSHARSYRSPFTAYEALEKVVAMRGEHFDGATVDALANEISVFPLDSYVKLSSGAIGRVIATNPENLMRPTIEVLWNETWAPIDPKIMALDKVPEIAIERPLHESEVPIT
ncbi:MAG: HD domain-containing protein [Gemmatimonadetes bacterium]|nr:HD domain-containing protein [Gemmatimonadota bacterium]